MKCAISQKRHKGDCKLRLNTSNFRDVALFSIFVTIDAKFEREREREREREKERERERERVGG